MVFIPCLNEEENISWVVNEIRERMPGAAVLVIDDGSSDNTAEKAREAGEVVVRNPVNKGLGYCLKSSFALALEAGFDYMVRLDGDGQHDPVYIKSLLRPLEEMRADMVIGSRYFDKKMEEEDKSTTLPRRKCRKIFSHLVRLRTGLYFSDPNSGYCACSRTVMRYLLWRELLHIPEVDILITLGGAGFRVRECPVLMRPRQAGKSSMRPKVVMAYLLSLFMKHFADMPVVRLKRPQPEFNLGMAKSSPTPLPLTVDPGVDEDFEIAVVA
jgi:glycosyltransferase involved in cell wall biosynthesis